MNEDELCMGSGRTLAMTQADVERHKKGVKLKCPVCGRRLTPTLMRDPSGNYEGELPDHKAKEAAS